MAGPPPKAGSRRQQRGRLNYSNVRLPKEGRKGPTPKWPLGGRAPAGWAALWRKPQAVMWEKQEAEYAVARYLKLRNMIDHAESIEAVKPAYFSELRQAEDSLGLTPKGMQNLRWEIEGTGQAADEEPAPESGQDAAILELQRRVQDRRLEA